MRKTKIYPAQDPCHEIKNGVGTQAQTFRGCTRALLTSDDINSIEWMLEQLTFIDGHDDIVNMAFEIIGETIDKGRERMDSLHGFLGAYDIDEDSGALFKPESERIQYDHLKIETRLHLVSSNKNKDGAA